MMLPRSWRANCEAASCTATWSATANAGRSRRRLQRRPPCGAWAGRPPSPPILPQARQPGRQGIGPPASLAPVGCDERGQLALPTEPARRGGNFALRGLTLLLQFAAPLTARGRPWPCQRGWISRSPTACHTLGSGRLRWLAEPELRCRGL